jgi:coproporphyrinogen III oxidase
MNAGLKVDSLVMSLYPEAQWLFDYVRAASTPSVEA